MVVQSVTSLSLVVALPLGAKITDQRISRRVLIGAVAMVAGIVVFLLAGSPQGGTSQPDAAAWWAAILATVVVIGSWSVSDGTGPEPPGPCSSAQPRRPLRPAGRGD